jgi:hypothetical protein
MDTFLSTFGLRRLNSKKAFQVLGLALGILLVCVPAFSQLNLGSISGTVTERR